MTPRRRRSAVVFGFLGASLVAIVSCEVLVSGDLPAFQCSGIDPDSCPVGLVCDEIRGTCVPEGDGPHPLPDGRIPPREDSPTGPTVHPIGEPCAKDSECLAGLLCGTTTLLTPGIIRDGVALCTKTCCNTNDCPDGFVCYAPATGGNYCVKGELADRPVLGTLPAGEPCSISDECRSGLCLGQACTDTCCGAANECGGKTTCRIEEKFKGPVVGGLEYVHRGWFCLPIVDGDAGAGSFCGFEQAVCASFNCLTGGSASDQNNRCRPTCCTTADCVPTGLPTPACVYVKQDQDYVKECLSASTAPDAGPDGVPCNAERECTNRFCDPTTHRCGRICCRDQDCQPGETCEPEPSGQPLLRCVKAN